MFSFRRFKVLVSTFSPNSLIFVYRFREEVRVLLISLSHGYLVAIEPFIEILFSH